MCATSPAAVRCECDICVWIILVQDTGQLFAVKVFSLLDREKRRQLDREIGTLLRSLENGYVGCRVSWGVIIQNKRALCRKLVHIVGRRFL